MFVRGWMSPGNTTKPPSGLVFRRCLGIAQQPSPGFSFPISKNQEFPLQPLFHSTTHFALFYFPITRRLYLGHYLSFISVRPQAKETESHQWEVLLTPLANVRSR